MRLDKEKLFEDLQMKNAEVYGNEKVKRLLEIVIDTHYTKVDRDEVVYDDELLMTLYEMIPEMDLYELHEDYGMCCSIEMQQMINGEYESEYKMLSRLKQDCEYFLGNGNRCEKHLWGGTVAAHIDKMFECYNMVPIEPEWITYQDILRYEGKMTTLKSLDDLRNLLEGHGWKVEDYGNDWDIHQHSPADEEFIFPISHNKSLENAVEDICRYAMDFDEEEHVFKWLKTRYSDNNYMNVPPLKILMQDAEDIQKLLNDLEFVLNKCEILEKEKEFDHEL